MTLLFSNTHTYNRVRMKTQSIWNIQSSSLDRLLLDCRFVHYLVFCLGDWFSGSLPWCIPRFSCHWRSCWFSICGYVSPYSSMQLPSNNSTLPHKRHRGVLIGLARWRRSVEHTGIVSGTATQLWSPWLVVQENASQKRDLRLWSEEWHPVFIPICRQSVSAVFRSPRSKPSS